jgi:predicted nucleic acid-binding Zn ribbon protein
MGYKDREFRKKSVQPLQDILKEIMGTPSMSRGIYPSRIPAAWNEVMGPSVARVTKNVFYRNGVVFVTLYSSTIRAELMMYRDKIVQRLNDHIGNSIVKELVLR